MRGKPIVTAVIAGVCLWGCKTITEELPTTANSPTNPTITVPFPVVVTPIATPVPQSPTAPTPTPAPSSGEPNTTPTPSPSSPPTSSSCRPVHETGNQRDKALPFERCQELVGE